MNELDYMERVELDTRITYTDRQKVGNEEVLTNYILYSQRSEVEYSLKDESYNKEYWLVKDIYRFYVKDGIDIKQTESEISYQSKTYNSDPVTINEIKTFLKTPQLVISYVHTGDNWVSKTEILPTIEKAFRIDTLIGNDYQSKIEIGSIRDSGYKCFIKCKLCNRFKCYDDFYVGGLADMNDIDMLPTIIEKINNYEASLIKTNKTAKVLSLNKNIV